MLRAQKAYLEDENNHKEESADTEDPKLIVVILPFAIMIAVLGSVLSYYAMTEGVKSVHVNAGLCLSYLMASMGCAYVMKRFQGKTYSQSMDSFFKGMGSLMSVGAILALAWALSSICSELGTGPFLASLIGEGFNPAFFPIVVFFIGAMMSFATGSSFGTFAILMATTLPVAHILGADLVLTIAAILSGGLFGDHTSPISDTTVLASMGAGCPHINHVSTQFPYALLTGTMTVSAFVLLAIYQTPYVIFIMIALQYLAIRFMMHRYGE